jgi:copper chaperone CopZ
MKKLFFVVLLTIFLGSIVCINAEESIAKVEIKTSAICEHCKETIEKALNKVDGVKTAVLNVETKIATVEYVTEKVTVDDLRNAISKAGYDADEVKRDARAYKRLPKCCKG